MRNTLTATLILAISLATFQTASAQQGTFIEVRDFEAWSKLGVQYETQNDWEFALNHQVRLKSNASILDVNFTSLEANYSGFKNWEFGAGYRFLRKNDTEGNIQGFKHYRRFQTDLGYKRKFNRFTHAYRIRFQSKNEVGVSEAEGDFASKHLRFKAGLKYNIKNFKLDPGVSAEIFRHSEEGDETQFSKFRLTAGTSYKFDVLGTIKLFYRLERELNSTYPKTTNIVGFSYVYTIKPGK